MVRKVIFLIGVILVVGVALTVYGVYRSAAGVPASEIEADYLTSDDRYVDVSGARVRIRIEGADDAPPILLLHGFTYSLETWDAWAAVLATDHRVIRYDLLGHGLTGPDPEERYAPAERAAFIGDVLDALQIDRAIIAGNSLGGLAAWRFAANNPARVDALILISPGAYPLNGVGDEPAEIPDAMKAYLLTAPEAGVAASMALVYGDDDKITDARRRSLRAMMRREGNGWAMIKSLEEFALPDPTKELQRIVAPTLIQWGEQDILIPVEQGERLAAAIANAKLITYPDAGHAAQEEIPAATVADAIAFLQNVARAAAGAENAPDGAETE